MASGAPAALIVLAGGTARRLGGVSKPDVTLHGRRMVDIVLDAGREEGCEPLVVVAPDSVLVPGDVLRTLEAPPGGGPVGGIAAGLSALVRDAAEDGDALVLACDMPGAAGLIGPLLAARAAQVGAAAPDGEDGTALDGVIAQRPDGRCEMLAHLVSCRALARALREGGDRDRSVRSLLDQLHLEGVTVPDGAAEDIDTWEQHAQWERRSLSDLEEAP